MKVVSMSLLALLVAPWPACRTAPGGDPAFTTEECSDTCSRIAAADCGDVGSSCVSACLRHPQASYGDVCPLELKRYLGCYWAAESFQCSAAAETEPVGCEEQRATHEACRSSSGAGGMAGNAPDAGGTASDSGGAGAAGAGGDADRAP
jgi:hypothetical protein